MSALYLTACLVYRGGRFPTLTTEADGCSEETIRCHMSGDCRQILNVHRHEDLRSQKKKKKKTKKKNYILVARGLRFSHRCVCRFLSYVM
jgi:hypothetical protein